jgi:PTH1 family peptidyl-tRNA hydrolase
MRIVVGLGNPGREYAGTRHNVGFLVVDELARRVGADGWRKKFRAELSEGPLPGGGGKLLLVKPQTFMNLSGNAVGEVVRWYHTPIEHLLVVQDDLDLPFAELRLRQRGTAGGQKGVASIIGQLGTNEVARLKIGIGRGRGRTDPSDHVLSRFSREEEAELPFVIGAAADAVERWAREGIDAAMNATNGKAEGAGPGRGKRAGDTPAGKGPEGNRVAVGAPEPRPHR